VSGPGGWGRWTQFGENLLAGTAPAATYDFNGHLIVAAVGTGHAIWLFAPSAGGGFTERDLGYSRARSGGEMAAPGVRRAQVSTGALPGDNVHAGSASPGKAPDTAFPICRRVLTAAFSPLSRAAPA
jgi:hypothetical protein